MKPNGIPPSSLAPSDAHDHVGQQGRASSCALANAHEHIAQERSSLVDILTSSVNALENAYAQAGGYPSLDAPFVSKSNALDKDPQLDHLSRVIVAAAAQIIATVRAPMETIQEYATGSYAAASLNLVVDVHVADILKDAGSKGIHIDDIATRAGVSSERLARLLRYLATRHIFREVAPDVFANNRISSMLIKHNSIETITKQPSKEFEGAPGAAFVGHATDECMRGAVELSSWVKNPGKYRAPFNAGHRVDVDLFQWYESEKRHKERFHVSMTGGGEIFPASIFLEGFEWASLEPDSVVVDVGGSVGSVTLTVFQKHPNLRYVVQDLESVVYDDGSEEGGGDAAKFWKSHNRSALIEGRVKLQAIDFFQSQPVKDAAVYFMRTILHDWPSDKCRTILKVIREAAGPQSKLIVFDMMMPYACEYDGPFAGVVSPEKPPFPLLANLGLGMGGFVTWVDIQMMNLLDGQERTVGQFIELGKATGWKLESVKPGTMAALLFSPM